MKKEPSYIQLYKSGKLYDRIEALNAKLEVCTLCPRSCGINRLKDEAGVCRTGKMPIVSSHNVHFGEEPPISGISGSGTIFFTNCNLRCVFCQNYPISQMGNGKDVSLQELATIMVTLQQRGCHNINLVSPTHVIAQVVEALPMAIDHGLKIPFVYNSGGYDSCETLRLLDGIVDIYMPDAKYANDESAKKYSDAPNYVQINQKAVKEMYRQVGDLVIDKTGVAERGLLVRHLVLPDDIANSQKVLEFIAEEISQKTYISLMAQYHPAYRSNEFPSVSRKITQEEYERVLAVTERLGLERGWRQLL
ncbi:MAG: radical SAM protein [bacterium]